MAEKRVSVDRSLVAVPRARPYRRRHNRHMARDVGTGLLYTAGAGAVIALLANIDSVKNSKEAKDHWWLLPVGLVGVGYMLRKRRHPYAGAVVAVGGALFAIAYAAQKEAEEAKKKAQQQQEPQPAPAPQKLSYETAGPPLLDLPEEYRKGVWLQMEDGRIVRLSMPKRVARRG